MTERQRVSDMEQMSTLTYKHMTKYVKASLLHSKEAIGYKKTELKREDLALKEVRKMASNSRLETLELQRDRKNFEKGLKSKNEYVNEQIQGVVRELEQGMMFKELYKKQRQVQTEAEKEKLRERSSELKTKKQDMQIKKQGEERKKALGYR